jgi:hypothetical protein
MKNIILSLIFVLLCGCSKTEDDTDVGCSTDCTSILIKFETLNKEGLSDIEVQLNYRITFRDEGGPYLRKIVGTKSDKNGQINEQFYLKEEELGNSTKGFFQVLIDDSKLNSDEYIKSDNKIGNTKTDLGFSIYSISQRDTIINQTFYFPKKTFIKINLNDFIPQLEDDYFEVRSQYPFGPRIGNNDFLDSEFATGFSGYGTFMAKGINTQLNIFVAENEKNIISIIRRKNGVSSTEDFPIFVPSNNTIVLTYTY